MWIWYAVVAVIYIAIAVAAYLLTPGAKQQNQPVKDQAFDVPIAEIGRKIPVLFGTRDIGELLIVWYGDVEIVPIVEQIDSGKKL